MIKKNKKIKKNIKKKRSVSTGPFSEFKKEYKKLIRSIKKFFNDNEKKPIEKKYRILKKINKKKRIVKKTKRRTKKERKR